MAIQIPLKHECRHVQDVGTCVNLDGTGTFSYKLPSVMFVGYRVSCEDILPRLYVKKVLFILKNIEDPVFACHL